MPGDARICVEVVYAEPGQARVQRFLLDAPARLEDALAAAAAHPRFAGIEVRGARAGVFGQVARPDHVLAAGDRVEIYRPLKLDPQAARRARVQKSRRRPPRC